MSGKKPRWQITAYEEALEDRKRLAKGSLLRRPRKIQMLTDYHWRYRLIDIWPSTKKYRWNYNRNFKSQDYSGSLESLIIEIDKKMKQKNYE